MSVSEDLLCAFELLKVRVGFRPTNCLLESFLARLQQTDSCSSYRWFAAARHGSTQARARQDSTTAFVEFVKRVDAVVGD